MSHIQDILRRMLSQVSYVFPGDLLLPILLCSTLLIVGIIALICVKKAKDPRSWFAVGMRILAASFLPAGALGILRICPILVFAVLSLVGLIMLVRPEIAWRLESRGLNAKGEPPYPGFIRAMRMLGGFFFLLGAFTVALFSGCL